MDNLTKKWVKDLCKHMSEKDIQMNNRNLKRCSGSLIIREKQVRTKVSCCLPPHIRKAEEEFLLWCNGISSISGTLGCRFDPWPGTRGKDAALPQLWCRLQLQLGSDPWPGNSICLRVAKKVEGEKKKRQKIGVPWWLNWLRMRHCLCYGLGLVPDLGTPHATGVAKKKKKIKKERY